MRVVIQRVKRASVTVEQEGADEVTSAPLAVVSEIGKGIVCLVGVKDGDEADDALWMCKQITSAKLFEGMSEANADKRWRSNVKQNGFEILLVSQVRLDRAEIARSVLRLKYTVMVCVDAAPYADVRPHTAIYHNQDGGTGCHRNMPP